MSISGVGGVGAGLGGALSIGAAGLGLTGAVSPGGAGATGSSPAAGLSAALPPNLQALTQTLRDFSSAEILIALLLMSALSGDDDQKKSSAGAALLAGMALAGWLAQGGQAGLLSGGQVPIEGLVDGAATAGMAGASLNVSA